MSELVNTELGIPSLPSSFVSRTRLITCLNSGLTQPVTVLSAPLGYGKTLLLADWAHSEKDAATRPSFAWVSLHESDDDPRRFWSRVAAALDHTARGVWQDAILPLYSQPAPVLEALLTTLVNRLSAHAQPIVLVLDDYHLISADAIHASLSFFIDRLPPQLHMVIASETDPPLPLARWRARGHLVELRAADLRFDHEEATMFLNEHMKLIHAHPAQPEAIAALEIRIEGWIAGLQLAAFALRERQDLNSIIAGFKDRHRNIVDYLAEIVLHRQPPETQRFLLQTSILDPLCGSLCDGITGDSSGWDTLEVLWRSNLFVTRLDDHGQWYQYHRLFADFLRNRLFHTQQGLLPTLHRRASEWYALHHMPDEAIQHALAANDYDRAARLIGEAAPQLYQRGEMSTLLGWLGALPEPIMRGASSLCILHARALSAAGHLEAAQRRLIDAESAPDRGPAQQVEIDGLRSRLSSPP